jgi:ferredoxin
MTAMRYIEKVVTLELDPKKCNGCSQCTLVCPHAVFELVDGRARIADKGACMECGACARNCAQGAISLQPGVGCAAAIINSWIHGGEPSCGC